MDERGLLTFLQRTMSGEVWLSVAYITSMFLVLAFRPQQVGSPALLRTSNVLFGLYIVIPAMTEGLVSLLTLDTPPGQMGGPRREVLVPMVVISQVANVAGKVLFALSVFCGLVALRTRPAPMYTPRELPD